MRRQTKDLTVGQVGNLPPIYNRPAEVTGNHSGVDGFPGPGLCRFTIGGRLPTCPTFLFLAMLMIGGVHGETGYDAWLRYAPLENADAYRESVPAVIATLGDSKIVE